MTRCLSSGAIALCFVFGCGGTEDETALAEDELARGDIRLGFEEDPDAICDLVLYRVPGEALFGAGARFTPPAYPFEVKKIEMRFGVAGLSDGYRCAANVPHALLLWKTGGIDVPGGDPNRRIAVDPGDARVTRRVRDVVGGDGPFKEVTQIIALKEPMTLRSGEHIVAAHQFGGGDGTCLLACPAADAENRRRNYMETGSRGSWDTVFGTSGFDAEFRIAVIGR